MEDAQDSENKKNAEPLVKHFIPEMPISKAIENLMKLRTGVVKTIGYGLYFIDHDRS